MSNYDERYHMKPWSGEGGAPSPSRYKIDSFVGTTVVVISLDGIIVRIRGLLCKLLEVSPKGFLFRVLQSRDGFPEGMILFASTCSFQTADDD